MRTRILTGVVLLTQLVAIASVAQADFVAGNVVIYRVGTGSNARAANGNEVFLDEYTPAGALVQSVALPSLSGVRLIAEGTDLTEGLLSRSPDGTRLVLTGYNASPGGSFELSTTFASATNRTVAVVNQQESITLYGFSDIANAAAPRSAVINGNNLYVAGSGGTGSTDGTHFQDAGTLVAGSTGNTSTQLHGSPTDLRQVNIFGGQLYVSTSTGDVATVGAGQPTTGGQTVTDLPGVSGSGDPYAFFFADLNGSVAGVDTLYVASMDSDALTKYSLTGGTWVDNGTIDGNIGGYVGITGSVSGSTVTLFATAPAASFSD